MAKLVVFALLLTVSVLAAGLFGILHNQISYSIGPDYFHKFKFIQFGIPAETLPRIGAARVGWSASWWMGLILGIPAFLLGLLIIKSPQNLWQAGKRALIWSVGVTTLFSCAGVVFGLAVINRDTAASIPLPVPVEDPIGFIRAGVMHDASYLGGFLALFAAIWIIFRAGKAE